MPQINSITDVVEWRLCLGCGACAYICPDKNIQLWDFINEGIRPVLKSDNCGACKQCLDVCPAVQSDFSNPHLKESNQLTNPASKSDPLLSAWGPVLEIWEGHAVDPEIRFKGSSGGVLTAIGLYCIESGYMDGVLHIAQDPADPIRNYTRLSRTREELVSATGSRYSPASVCNHLEWIEQSARPSVVIGKPSEIAALRKAQKLRPDLNAKVGIALSFFCAETPATQGTISLLAKLGINSKSLSDLRYRGLGWPGHFAPTCKDEGAPRSKLTYRESWAFLQAFRPWSVHLWPDGTGELADISCGDPWYETHDSNSQGSSLIVVRTERGRVIIENSIKAGYLKLERAEFWKLAKSQRNLLEKKQFIWGRLFALRLFSLPTPKYVGANLFGCWLRLPIADKFKSITGTIRRVILRKLYKPLKLDLTTAQSVQIISSV